MGKPIIAYSIEAAKAANIFDRIIISSDSEGIIDVSLQYGAEAPFLRPAELSDDFCGLKQVFDHAVSEIESDNMTLFLRAAFCDRATSRPSRHSPRRIYLKVILHRAVLWQ